MICQFAAMPDQIKERHCTIETCIQRDPKGLYKKALANKIPNFTGISAPYESPLHPELVVNTDDLSIRQSTDVILDLLQKKKIVPV